MGIIYDLNDMRIYKITLYGSKVISPKTYEYISIGDALKDILSEDEYLLYRDSLDKLFKKNPDDSTESILCLFTDFGWRIYDDFLDKYKELLAVNHYVLYSSSRNYLYKKSLYKDKYQLVLDVNDIIEEDNNK